MTFTLPKEDQIQGKSILEIGSLFWEEDRRQAFQICYKAMRIIDDLVDEKKAVLERCTQEERDALIQQIHYWMPETEDCPEINPKSFRDTCKRFCIPTWTWHRWRDAMIYDLFNKQFATFKTFLKYSEGAAIAPGTIYLHLCGIQKSGQHFVPPVFSPYHIARPLALYSYLIHIIRDFQEDYCGGLYSFAEDILHEHNITCNELIAIAKGSPIPQRFYDVIRTYLKHADYYKHASLQAVKKLPDYLSRNYLFSIYVIYDLYCQLHNRIPLDSTTFSCDAINLSSSFIAKRLEYLYGQFQQNVREVSL